MNHVSPLAGKGAPAPGRAPVWRVESEPKSAADVLLCAEEDEAYLRDELRRQCPALPIRPRAPGVLTGPTGFLAGPGSLTLPDGSAPPLVFARQVLPTARQVATHSIREAAGAVFAAIIAGLPEGRPWLLHVVAHYGAARAGINRCRLIREAVLDRLQRQRRGLRRALAPDAAPLTAAYSVVQLLLLAPDAGWLSVLPAPGPFQLRRALSPFPKGWVTPASDRSAPCRAFAKLVEAETRLGRRIRAGESCVDLGACPGSWSYVALGRGACVTAVDRSPPRSDLLAHQRLRFVRGDAFRFTPAAPVDWLLCDVIAAPERSMDLLRTWVAQRWARHFVVTLKFKGTAGYDQLDELKRALPPLTNEFFLQRLCANRNEACAFGSVAAAPESVHAERQPLDAAAPPQVSVSAAARG
jgi:23S rRNA (cytidine2498-2'-O)-methyltransferase